MRPGASLGLSVLLALAGVLAGPDALAQPPQMARDIRTQPVTDLPDLTGPHTATRLGAYLYFGADDGLHGFELWRTDGTAAGTEMVADVCPGQCNGVLFGVGPAVGGLLYFRADDGVHGTELWVSDGTAAGTRMVRDIAPARSSFPTWLTPLGDRVVFTAQEPEHGRELWISDATEGGTLLLEDLMPGAESSTPSGLLATEGTLFFNARDAVHGREPWASDGTPGAAVRLGDIWPGASSSVPEEPEFPNNPRSGAVLDGLYLFAAEDGVSEQLWASDGSPGGTAPLSSIDPPPIGTQVFDLTALGSWVYFVAADTSAGPEIWRSDGTPAGTQRVTDVQPGYDTRFPRGLTAVGDRLYFSDGTAATGDEPWISDGTGAGTHPVADVRPGPEGSADWGFWFTGGWALDAERMVFFPDDGSHGFEPWVSDGTAGGTFLLHDVAPGPPASHPALVGPFGVPAPVAGGLAFFAWNREIGFEPWWTDGTTAGTRLLRDLDQQASSLYDVGLFSVAQLVAVGHRLFFQAVDDAHGLELWTSGGTPGTTRLVADLETTLEGDQPGGSAPFFLVPLEDSLVFQARLRHGGDCCADGEAWRTDGTTAGTFPLVTGGETYAYGKAAGVAFFTGDDGFWTSDGTVAGTYLLPGVEEGSEPVEVAGRVLFAGTTAATGQELYALDADRTAAELVADLLPGPASSRPFGLTRVGDLLLFAATTPATGWELWVSDGSEANSGLLADIRPGPDGSISEFALRRAYGGTELPRIVASGPRAFVAADDGVHGTELWVSDGTPAGTRLLADLRPGPLGSNPVWMTDVGGRLYFVAEDGATGAELWTTDGTAAGTRRVADLAPGAASSSPRFLVDVDGALHFAAFTPSDGVELWRLDAGGAPELVADLLPGPDSSSPSYLTVAGRRLFFFANDGVHGFEPWSLVLPSRKLHAALSARRQGATVFLDVLLSNPTPVDQPDADGDELVLPLPAALTPVAVEATGGVAEIVGAGGLAARAAGAAGAHTLLWNGALPAGATETISVELTLGPGLAMPVTLQAQLFFDTDADGANDLAVLSDDPSTPGATDPTVVTAPQVVEVPALGGPGLALLTLVFTLLALWRLRYGDEVEGR